MANKNKRSNNIGTIKLVESNLGGRQFGEAPAPRIVAQGRVGDSQNFTPKMTHSVTRTTNQPVPKKSNPKTMFQTILNKVKRSKS